MSNSAAPAYFPANQIVYSGLTEEEKKIILTFILHKSGKIDKIEVSYLISGSLTDAGAADGDYPTEFKRRIL